MLEARKFRRVLYLHDSLSLSLSLHEQKSNFAIIVMLTSVKVRQVELRKINLHRYDSSKKLNYALYACIKDDSSSNLIFKVPVVVHYICMFSILLYRFNI